MPGTPEGEDKAPGQMSHTRWYCLFIGMSGHHAGDDLDLLVGFSQVNMSQAR